MPVPSSISTLSTIAGNNSPSGSESPTLTDDYFRAHAAFIAQLRDSGTTTDGLAVKKDANTTTGAAILPSGSAIQRPGSPSVGMVRHQTDIDDYEFYLSTGWIPRSTFRRAINEAVSVTIPSAATTSIFSALSNTINVTGTNTITSLGTSTQNGVKRTLIFSDALTLTHNATSLILPGGANISVAAGDVAEFVSISSSGWRCIRYLKADGKAIVASQTLFSGTAQAATSGTAIDFTGIPSNAQLIYLMLSGVSTTGTSNFQIQAGSGSVETSGYSSASSAIGSAVSSINTTTGFGIRHAQAAASTFDGLITLARVSGNNWSISGVVGLGTAALTTTLSGSKTFSGAIDRLRFTTVGGTDTFDAGVINIAWGIA